MSLETITSQNPNENHKRASSASVANMPLRRPWASHTLTTRANAWRQVASSLRRGAGPVHSKAQVNGYHEARDPRDLGDLLERSKRLRRLDHRQDFRRFRPGARHLADTVALAPAIATPARRLVAATAARPDAPPRAN